MSQQAKLEQMLELPDPLIFQSTDITWLLDHVGGLDGDVRDHLTYSLLSRGFMAGGFTTCQKVAVATQVEADKGLWTDIGSDGGDQVFLRSFSALLGALILGADAQSPFLTASQQTVWFRAAVDYLPRERDRRGFVPGRGWAHAMAHGSDFLSAAIRHPAFPVTRRSAAMHAIRAVLDATQAPFQDDEEERLAVVLQGFTVDASGCEQVAQLLTDCGAAYWQEYDREPSNNQNYYRISTFKRVCEALYFLAPNVRQAAQAQLDRYFSEMGLTQP
ncbi:DUF2785 domain-containing protein [Lacticaseibacillus daqingensis]|uniref:DUF2785 domain-containing protein n=1 Tax=Lacticaseibacillus daqingensis TaxID=2486014 RepID=UPI000F7841CD|nr:DUF2785 domain-containing protein [Lacticaseibacillus daqingensis]